MELNNYLKSDLFVNKKFKDKESALIYFCKLLKEKKYIASYKEALDAVLEREKQFPTNIAPKIAMPHILNDTVLKPVILFAKVQGLEWDDNGNKVDYIFFLCYNKEIGESAHMNTIQELSGLLMNEEKDGLNLYEEFEKVKNTSELKKLISKFTTKDESVEIKESNKPKSDKNSSYDIVAITACPTGVAHTFLAKDMLEKKAKEMGVSIKVETQGTEGSRNTLSEEDIKNAKGVILALDRSIDTSKFAGKENVVEISTRAAIKNPEVEIKKVLNNEGKTFKGSSQNNSSKFEDHTNLISFNNFGKRIYQSLMNGVGHMLPFVIFGGIIIAIAFMIDSFAGVPVGMESELGKYYEVSNWFKQLGDISFGLMVPILAAYMAFGLVGKGGLLPGFVVGMMATGKMVSKSGFPYLLDFLPKDKLDMLSNGSGFFGAIGGALLAATIFILLTKYVFSKMPKSMNAINNILFMPLFGTFITAGLFFLINIPLQFLNLGFALFLDVFANRPELYPILGIIMGLMMCADLGGPINKAAYVFGTITLANSGQLGSVPMAIAMGAGMVPPLAIALSGTFDKKVWTEQQRKQSYVNYVMGISFISEGAIPYTAEQPRKMIISNLIGGAITGIMIAALQIGSLAPHGGIFISPLLRCQLDIADTESLQIGLGVTFFLISVLAGAIIEAIIIGVLSRTKFGKNPQLA